MFKLPVRTWILNAAAVFSGRHGAVTQQAEQAGCSRQTVYQHAQKREQRLGEEPAADRPTEDRAGFGAVTAPEPPAGPHILLDKDKQKELATTAFAMGLRGYPDLYPKPDKVVTSHPRTPIGSACLCFPAESSQISLRRCDVTLN
jgi:hypothetical protein